MLFLKSNKIEPNSKLVYQEQFLIILKTLPFVGINFTIEKKCTSLSFSKVMKIVMNSLYKAVCLLIPIYCIYSSVFQISHPTKILKFTTASLHVILFLMRASMYSKKSSILKVLSKLKHFEDSLQNKNRRSLRKCALFTCSVSVAFPFIILATVLPFVLSDFEQHSGTSYLSRTMLHSSRTLFQLAFTALQVVYTIHAFVFPALVMTLLGFIYKSFVDVFRRHITEIRMDLQKDLSRETVSRSLKILETAQRMHCQVEEAISFTIVLAYALAFGNVLNLVGVISSDYMSSIKVVRDVYFLCIFLWTTTWFVLLTLCGSRVFRASHFLKSIALEIIPKNLIDARFIGNKELIYVQLFNTCSKLELHFTAWGMFQVDKKLLLTTSGVMVTYGVLIATELK